MIEGGLSDAAAPGIDLVAGTPFFEFAVDWMATLGLDLTVLGVALLIAARQAAAHRIVAHIVIWQEALRGIAADLWIAGRAYSGAWFYLGFALFHLVVIATGVWALRRTPSTRRIEVAI